VIDAAQRYMAHLYKQYGRSLYVPEREDGEEERNLDTAADFQMQNGAGGYATDRPSERPPLLEPATPELTQRDDRYQTTNPTPDWPSGQRPTSWADSSALPSLGCWCSCCRGPRWWCEREKPRGWRCGRCHPPDHLPVGNVRWIETKRH
jgi:hypothetical protein